MYFGPQLQTWAIVMYSSMLRTRFDPYLIRNVKRSNRLLFGINSEKKPEPGSVKKMILMLIGAKIMKYTTTRESRDEGKTFVNVCGALCFDTADASKLPLNVNHYWNRVKLKQVSN